MVYMGADEYEILAFDDKQVRLFDTQFPLFNKEMDRAEFDRRVRENPLNDHLKVKELPSEEKTDKAPAFDIGMGQFVYQNKLWFPLQRSTQIKLFQLNSAIVNLFAR